MWGFVTCPCIELCSWLALCAPHVSCRQLSHTEVYNFSSRMGQVMCSSSIVGIRVLTRLPCILNFLRKGFPFFEILISRGAFMRGRLPGPSNIACSISGSGRCRGDFRGFDFWFRPLRELHSVIYLLFGGTISGCFANPVLLRLVLCSSGVRFLAGARTPLRHITAVRGFDFRLFCEPRSIGSSPVQFGGSISGRCANPAPSYICCPGGRFQAVLRTPFYWV
jgi:hypothetical protein